MSVKIALAQFEGVDSTEANRSKIVELIAESAAAGADLVCFHEFSTTPYFCYDHRNEAHFALAEPIPGPSTERVAAAATEHDISVVLPLYELTAEGKRHNTAALIEPGQGVVDIYRKTHAPHSGDYHEERGADESFYFDPGDTGFRAWHSARTGLKIGALICYDRHFFEGPRSYGLQDVQIVFVPTATYRRFIIETLWEIELQAMAFQNSFYVAGVNKVGRVMPAPEKSYPGHSLVVDPEGRTIVRADDQEGIVYADIDPEAPMVTRDQLRFLSHRRPEMYDLVTGPR